MHVAAYKESRNQNKGGVFIVDEARLPGECTDTETTGDDCSYKKKEATTPVSDEVVVDPFHFGTNVSPNDYVNDYANENCCKVCTQPCGNRRNSPGSAFKPLLNEEYSRARTIDHGPANSPEPRKQLLEDRLL